MRATRFIPRRLAHLTVVLALPLRELLGPLFRRRPILTYRRAEQDRHLDPLPAPWNSDSRWYPRSFPPRAHNHVSPLVHGADYFTDLCRELHAARTRVTICGWCMTPLMPLLREDGIGAPGSILADILNEVSQRAEVYVLLWSGAPALFEPSTHTAEEAVRTLQTIAPRVRAALDRRAQFSHDHHQKAITIDGRTAYVGGMDLTTYQGDRWDTAQHPLRFGPNWHDVQMRIEGEAVQDVESNFCQRWNAVTGQHIQPLKPMDVHPQWNQPAQVIRTVPAGFYPFAPHGEYGIAHAYVEAIHAARRFIYLENQYLWSPEIVEALVDAMNRRRTEPFRIVLVLPAKAYTGKYDNDAHVRTLMEADAERGIFHAYSPHATGPAFGRTGYRYFPIYVHAKVGIVDDEWVTVGSANLNGRGLATDTEMNVQLAAPEVARTLRLALWSDHLGIPEAELAAADPVALIDTEWKDVATRLQASARAGTTPPPGHVMPYVPGSNPGSRALDVLQGMLLER